jgi:hypothetical protein
MGLTAMKLPRVTGNLSIAGCGKNAKPMVYCQFMPGQANKPRKMPTSSHYLNL